MAKQVWVNWLYYRLLKWSVINPLFRTLYFGRVQGQEHVPLSGPLIIVSNHASYFDPPLLSNAMRRPVAFMAKAELFEVPLLKQAIQLYGAYPVKRGGVDRTALKASEAALADGWAVGIFLNGTRTDDARIPDPHLGAALLSARTQVPLLPVALWGTHQVFPKGQRFPKIFNTIKIAIGPVPSPPNSTDRPILQAKTDECVQVIHSLLDQYE